jgi:hypothetical protein
MNASISTTAEFGTIASRIAPAGDRIEILQR